jgi:hypothetical protein
MKHILVMILAIASAIAADANGRWTGTLTTRNSDGSDRVGPALLVLKQDGATITGSAGPDDNERHEIQNGKAENGNLTFEVATGETIMKFSLKHEGDEIKGEITRERDGQTQTARLDLKRSK